MSRFTTTGEVKPDLVLDITTREDSSYDGERYFYVTCHFLTHGLDKYARNGDHSLHYRNPGSSSFDPYHELRDLQLRACVTEKHLDWGVYGQECEYRDCYSVGLERAREMVKVLDKVQKGLEKIEAEYGSSRTFGQFCLRVAKVLGACGMSYVTRETGRAWGLDGQDRAQRSLPDGAAHIDHLFAEWIQVEREKVTVA